MFTGHRATCPYCHNALVVLREDDAEEPLVVPERTFTVRRHEALTPRETEVLHLAGRGLSNSAIGAHLGVDVKTVKTHMSSVIDKLGVVNRTGAVTEGLRRGLIQMSEGEPD